ncbi:MAG: hypothetical protein PHW04_16585 [Candidatus Wallbacteria bacterium]|nr:hypothetical protein [Candidatus Wallbacteria bacterium]
MQQLNSGDIKVFRMGLLMVAVALIAVFLMYSYLSSPGEVVVSPNGDVQGFLSNLRVVLQGQQFWQDQLSLAKKELQMQRERPGELARRQKEVDDVSRQIFNGLDQDVEKLYQQHPDLRPTTEEQQAEMKSEQEEKQRQEATDGFFEQIILNRISDLEHKIIPYLTKKSNELPHSK